MFVKEGTINGIDGTELFFQVHTPSLLPKAAVLVVHGHGDHSGGLKNVLDRLTEHGYIACALDLRGHGKSSGTRGYIQTWEQYRTDLHTFRTMVNTEYPQLPLYVVAHSLGGIISLEYCLHHGTGIAGLVAIAPAISYEATLTDKLLVAFMSKIKPAYTIKKSNNLDLLTRDPEALTRLQSDALRHNTVTPGLGRGLMQTIPLLFKQASAIQLPILLQYGLGDEITPPTKIRQFYDSIGSQDKQRFEYDSVRHRPFDDLGSEQFFVDMINWLDDRSGS